MGHGKIFYGYCYIVVVWQSSMYKLLKLLSFSKNALKDSGRFFYDTCNYNLLLLLLLLLLLYTHWIVSHNGNWLIVHVIIEGSEQQFPVFFASVMEQCYLSLLQHWPIHPWEIWQKPPVVDLFYSHWLAIKSQKRPKHHLYIKHYSFCS